MYTHTHSLILLLFKHEHKHTLDTHIHSSTLTHTPAPPHTHIHIIGTIKYNALCRYLLSFLSLPLSLSLSLFISHTEAKSSYCGHHLAVERHNFLRMTLDVEQGV